MTHRTATTTRTTKETSIVATVDLDGTGVTEVATGLPFFDHMLDQLGRHGGMDLHVAATGDLHIDAHHTVEDVGIVLGELVKTALGDKVGIKRFADRTIPLDEALIEVVIDVSGRPFLDFDVPFAEDSPLLGTPGFDPQLTEEFFRAFVLSAGLTVHVMKRKGRNNHHVVEATFKAFARALRDAVTEVDSTLPSTKGAL
jgi:imidazoleglycerol-phosphate dehydratase